jgi:predicted dehydrogenase
MRFFAGDIVSVQGTATRRLRQEFRVEDTSYALIEFDSGVDGVVMVPGTLPAPLWDETSPYRAAQDLVECIETGREPRCNGQDGRAAIEAIMAIYESQRRANARVDLPLGIGESLLEILKREGQL